jgi:hypothetical protein
MVLSLLPESVVTIAIVVRDGQIKAGAPTVAVLERRKVHFIKVCKSKVVGV